MKLFNGDVRTARDMALVVLTEGLRLVEIQNLLLHCVHMLALIFHLAYLDYGTHVEFAAGVTGVIVFQAEWHPHLALSTENTTRMFRWDFLSCV